MLPSRLLFVSAVLICFQVATIFSTPVTAGPILFQEQPEAQPSGEKTKPEAKERLELLMKYKFDRTPQGILEAWSADKVKRKDKKKKEEDKKPITAKVTNSHKDFIFLEMTDEKSSFKKDQVLRVLDDQKKVIGQIKILTIEGKEVSARTEKPEAKKPEGEDKPDANSENKEGNSDVEKIEDAIEMIEEEVQLFPTSSSITSGATVGTYSVSVAINNQEPQEQDSETDTDTDTESDDKKESDEKADTEKKKADEAEAASDKPKPLAVKTGDTIELQPIDAKEKSKKQTERLQAEVKKLGRDVSLGKLG